MGTEIRVLRDQNAAYLEQAIQELIDSLAYEYKELVNIQFSTAGTGSVVTYSALLWFVDKDV